MVNPVLIEVTRGPLVESRHRGAVAVVDTSGALVAAWGEIEAPILPRSTLKPFQAIPLLQTGAADRYRLGEEEIALACASHGGEPDHVGRIGRWLERQGLSPANLVCGPHPPLSEGAARDLARAGLQPSPLHNNCSGKHAGFLTTALHLGEDTAGYGEAAHPVQVRVRQVLARLADRDASAISAVDGCGVPTFAITLRGLARAFAALADPRNAPSSLQEPLTRVAGAMIRHPHLVGGLGRFDTAVVEGCGGRVLVKSGAEGVYGAALREEGLGIALKVDDGAKRAAEAAMAALVLWFSRIGGRSRDLLGAYAQHALRNTAGARIGSVRPAPGWLS